MTDSDRDIAVNLLLSPTEFNCLQVSIDALIETQRDIIKYLADENSNEEIETIYEAIERLRAGLELKQTLELFNP